MYIGDNDAVSTIMGVTNILTGPINRLTKTLAYSYPVNFV